MMRLYIGNKNYSSWSMRPWVLMRQSGIAFEEVQLRFDNFLDSARYPDSPFKQALAKVTPVGKVPVLVDGDLAVWDTLAIAEYLAESFPEKQLWPQQRAARAHARSLCAEMHSGFGALRSHCPLNIEADLAHTGALLWRDQAALRADVQRIATMWSGLLQAHGGPMLFGSFSIADAYFAPVCSRLRSYALPLPQTLADYVARVLALPGVHDWVQQALAEHDFLAFEEPYRLAP
ncbi:MAG: glutathione S-transferase family protein [Rhodoferax sp.]